MAAPEVTIWSRVTATGIMERIGSSPRNAILVPEGVSYTWDQHGPSKASFNLRRLGGVPWPDLGPMSPIDIDVNGGRVWSGRISEAPQQTGDTNVINVQCEGWQMHLEDDLTTKLYVHSGLGDWVDTRGALGGTTPLNFYTTGYTVGSASPTGSSGGIIIALPLGQTIAGFGTAGVICNVGPNLTVARAILTYQTSTWVHTVLEQEAYNGANGNLANNVIVAAPLAVLGSTVYATSPPANTQQIELRVQDDGTATTGTNLSFVKLVAASLFGSTAWESGNASILKASDVFKDLLPKAPLLNQTDLSQITTTTFSIPELYVSSPSTPGEIMRGVNAYHDFLMGVDQFQRLFLTPKPTAASISIGSWSKAQVQDTAAGTSTDVYNKALLSGNAPDGTPLLVTRTSTSTLLTAQGVTRTKSIPLSGSTTAAAMAQLGDVFLSSHSTQPFKGSISGKGMDSFRNTLSGQPFAPYLVPTLAGRLVRLEHWIDPDTGGIGRDGRIAEATYTADDDQVTISLDNTRSNFEAFLGRLQVLTASSLGNS